MDKKVNVLLFFSLVLGFPLLLLFLPKEKSSKDEKRKLAEFPVFTSESYLNGTWTKRIDDYIDDHFPNREQFIQTTPLFHAAKGFQLKNAETVVVVPKKKKSSTDKKEENRDTLALLDEFEENFSGSMLIINGCVYPLGGGSPKMSKYFAKMVSEYAANFPNLRVFSAVAPLSSAFIPLAKYKHFNVQNKKTLTAIKENLSNGAIFSDVFEELNNHAATKLYFGTDHHWKPFGAYYAYVAFCKSAGLVPVPLKQMIKKVKYNFLGTMYQYTRDPSVLAHPDTMEYWEPKVETEAYNLGAYGTSKGSKAKVFYNTSSGGNTYSTFLGGDHPLMRIKTSVKNGKKAAVIKNSMGNAFTVYLISHYEEIWVVDLRYSKQNLTRIIQENNINDLVFAVGMYAAMSHGTIGMMRRLATQSGIFEKPIRRVDPAETVLPPANPKPDVLDTLSPR
jgi:hypothetical protein